MSLLRALASDDPTDPKLRVVSVADPAVATDFTFTVPGACAWELIALTAKLVTDGNAANRTPAFTITDGSDTLLQMPIGANVTASLTTQVSWVAGAAFTNTAISGLKLGVSIPRLILPAGFTFGPVTASKQAGDQWSIARATVIEVLRGGVEAERARQERIIERLIAIEDLLTPHGLRPLV